MQNKFNFKTVAYAQLVNPSPTDEISNHLEFFKERVELVNNTPAKYNQKYITVLGIVDGNKIKLQIESELEIGVVGKSLTGLSRALVTEQDGDQDFDPYYKSNIFHGKLLSYDKNVVQDIRSERVYMEIHEEQMLNSIIHIVLKPKTARTASEKNAIKQIKLALVNNEVIKE